MMSTPIAHEDLGHDTACRRREKAHLDLVDMGWPDLGKSLELLNGGNAKVGDANGFDLSLVISPFKGLPEGFPASRAATWGMNEHEVNVAALATKLLDALDDFGICGINVARGTKLLCG